MSIVSFDKNFIEGVCYLVHPLPTFPLLYMSINGNIWVEEYIMVELYFGTSKGSCHTYYLS